MKYTELLARLDAEPYGFDECARELPTGERQDFCPHWRPQSDRVCGPCVLHHIEEPSEESCEVCCTPVSRGDLCGNWLCREQDPRWFDRIHALGLLRGSLSRAVNDYKEHWGWALPFGRVISWVVQRNETLRQYDLITSLPHAPGERDRSYDPGQRIITVADRHLITGPQTDAGNPVITKTEETPSMRGLSARARQRNAEENLYPALEVPSPERLKGRAILVVDDVYTTGHSLNMVARKFIEKGSRQVTGLILGRAV